MFGALGMAQIQADYNAVQDGLVAAGRIFSLLDEPLDEDDPFGPDGEKPESIDGLIEFEAITFYYPTRMTHPVYYPHGVENGFNLSVPPKETVGFCGKSGCGKSTALQLLLRFYKCTEGKVLVDGKDVRNLNISWVRSQCGYVGQQPVLFAGSVRENILMGKSDATEEEIVNAAKAANAHDFIVNLSDGYDTDIGGGGSLLSGGQKQRISIARAIVGNPKILILDEATSALDNESEKLVQMALDEMQKQQPRTTLVVAHRLGTIKNCDQIAVLGHGGVEELGSHDELLEMNGLYKDLWTKQTGQT